MKVFERKYNKNNFYIIVCLFILIVFCTIIQFNLFPEKYFSDSNYILKLMDYNSENKGTAYYQTAELFKSINFFGFSTLFEWSIFISIILGIYIVYQLLKNDKYSLIEYIFIYMSVALLTFNVFNLSKDVIQFIIFTIISSICFSSIKNRNKILLICSIVVLESIIYRPYYILVFVGILISLIIFLILKYKTRLNGKLLLILITFILLLNLSKYFFPVQYNRVISVRNQLVNSLSVNTEIHNLIDNNSFFAFSINYIINLFRILIPVELLSRGVFYYYAFVIYKILLIYLLSKSFKYHYNKYINSNEKITSYIIGFCIIIGYYLCSAIYEPDFGSVIRHEITLFFLFFIEINSYYNDIRKMKCFEQKI